MAAELTLQDAIRFLGIGSKRTLKKEYARRGIEYRRFKRGHTAHYKKRKRPVYKRSRPSGPRGKLRSYQHGRSANVVTLAANIIAEAVQTWKQPIKADYYEVCFGYEPAGFGKCPHVSTCFPYRNFSGASAAFGNCTHKDKLLRHRLLSFFRSEWFEFLVDMGGNIEPGFARDGIGVPDLGQATET